MSEFGVILEVVSDIWHFFHTWTFVSEIYNFWYRWKILLTDSLFLYHLNHIYTTVVILWWSNWFETLNNPEYSGKWRFVLFSQQVSWPVLLISKCFLMIIYFLICVTLIFFYFYSLPLPRFPWRVICVT